MMPIHRTPNDDITEFYVDTNTDIDTNGDTNIRLLLAGKQTYQY